MIKGKILNENRGGGSTITQQLVGYMHPDIIDRREVSGTAGISRKLREQSAAREMERHYPKDTIIQAYINQINLGRGCMEGGARHYFGHPAAPHAAEAATLAGLRDHSRNTIPSHTADRERAPRRVSNVADQRYITQALADKTKLEPLVTAPNGGMSAAAGTSWTKCATGRAGRNPVATGGA